MFNRSKFINDETYGLIQRFNTERPDQPIEIAKILARLPDPINVEKPTLPTISGAPIDLPAVFFGYGATTRLESRTAGSTRRRFDVIITAIVNATETENLIDRSGKMDQLVDEIASEMKQIPFTDEVHIEDVYVQQTLTGGGTLSNHDYMQFTLSFIYEECVTC